MFAALDPGAAVPRMRPSRARALSLPPLGCVAARFGALMTAAALDAIEKEYQDNFANRPRVTRALDKLDGLLARLAPIAAGQGADADRARTMSESYGKERALIAELQAGGASAMAAHRANALANALTRRYARHFAGQSRRTRDVELLRELGDRVERCVEAMDEVATRWDHAVFADSRARHRQLLDAVRVEIGAIPQDQAGAAASEAASALAARANQQFRWYRLAFAGRDRSSRRPALLERMIRELEAIQAQMRALVAAGVQDATHAGNLGIVDSQLITWRQERAAISNARPRLDATGLFGAIAGEANAWFDQYRSGYRGKPRAEVSVDGLLDLCDALLEVGLHMDDVQRISGGDTYDKNLATVLENLNLYEREIDAVRQAQPPAA